MNTKIVLIICLLLVCVDNTVPKTASMTHASTTKSISAPSVIPSLAVLSANKSLKSSRRCNLLIIAAIAAGIGSYLAYKIFPLELAYRNAKNYLAFSDLDDSYDRISDQLRLAEYSDRDIYTTSPTLAEELSILGENRGPVIGHLQALRRVQTKAIGFLNRKQEVAALIGRFERILSNIDNTFKRRKAYMKLCEVYKDGKKIIDRYNDGLKKPRSLRWDPFSFDRDPSVDRARAQRTVLEYLKLDQSDREFKKKMRQQLKKWHPDKNRTLVKNALGEELFEFAQENDYNHMKTLAGDITGILNQILEK